MLLWGLFKTFCMIGLVSFGGGYAMIPVIETEVSRNGWMTTQQFTDAVAIAGMSPGAIATNSAMVVGYQTAGVLGATVAALGMILPSVVIILLAAVFFNKVHKNKTVQSAFYGLRPVVVGMIIYAAIKLALSNGMMNSISYYSISAFLLFALSLFALMRLRMHPVYVIILAGLVGVTLYS
ncbi:MULTISPECIES: chromate transporter [Bacillaceae]|jgi:chromate transporter|uniref:chromate transporter n=1 Tax=Bacillaceae TaxID=186817 RepID=UPI00101E2067|nr:chromate transporter [Ectobacillus funiculus]